MRRNSVRTIVFFMMLLILTVFLPNAARAQMCVRYARMLTSFDIQGDAWSWWEGAVGRYQRGVRPATGSVLVFRRTGHLQRGHVAVVSRVIDRRTILVDQSWLEGDVLHRNMKVIDSSPNNSWSTVRVWNDPSASLGLRPYPTYGFVYSRGGNHPVGMNAPLSIADAGNEASNGNDQAEPMMVRGPRSRMTGQRSEPVRAITAVATAATPAVATPAHKPVIMLARGVAATVADPSTEAGLVLASAPRHKPGAALPAQANAVEFGQVPQIMVPRHKPGVSADKRNTQVAEAPARETFSEIGD